MPRATWKAQCHNKFTTMQSLKPYLRYKLRILAQSALSTGVENDANEEEDAIDD